MDQDFIQRHYAVAGHTFSLHLPAGDPLLRQMEAYAPFLVAVLPSGTEPLFSLTVSAKPLPLPEGVQEDASFDVNGMPMQCGRTPDGYYFDFHYGDRPALRLLTDATFGKAEAYLMEGRRGGLDTALMVMYAVSSAPYGTLLFHASTVSVRGSAYLFLGKSGTGKSTHSRLWQKYIPGVQLINDDNPVVRMKGGMAYVYGSPWSGKTPCYRNVRMPVRAMVMLQQSPTNAIRRLATLEAYAAILGSVSGMQWNRRVADALHHTEEKLLSCVPIWHLDCRPDEEAARLCHSTVTKISAKEALEEAVRMVGEGIYVTIPVEGRSMLPFIVGGRDSAVLMPPKDISRGDVVLAWVGTYYVIHRVLRMEGNELTLMGDGNINLYEHCRMSDVRARVDYVIDQHGKSRNLRSLWRRVGAWLWVSLRRFRPVLLRVYRFTTPLLLGGRAGVVGLTCFHI